MASSTSHRIDDGFSTLVEMANFPNAKIYEKEVTPPGYDGGGRKDVSTMRNTAWHTALPKKLKMVTPVVFTGAYAGDCYDDLKSAVNTNQELTVTLPDGDTLVVWGWLDKFAPSKNKEGEQATADFTFEISNLDDDLNEVGPVYTAPPA